MSSETDLGVEINTRFTWGAHCKTLVSKASSRLGLLRRTCHFTTDKRQKRSFYLALVRSIFEHCSVIWSPQNATHLKRFADIQRRAIKWINGESFTSYSDEVFASKQKELNILPIKLKFIYNDLVLFYKVVNNLIPVKLPDYITVCQPEGLRYTRRNAQIHDMIDVSTYKSGIVPCSNDLRHSFFYRSMIRWNDLPVAVRQSESIYGFKSNLTKHLWTLMLTMTGQIDSHGPAIVIGEFHSLFYTFHSIFIYIYFIQGCIFAFISYRWPLISY